MQIVVSEPIELDDGYVLMNTEMLMELLAKGKSVYLPELAEMLDGVSGYDDTDMEDYHQGMKVSEIESVVYVSEEEVQCIEIDDDQHLYLTDGFVPTHNTSNIVFLKSTDDSMLDTLEKMSGKTHQVRIESKMITRDIEKMWMRNEGHANITLNVREEPVISYNDLAFLSERNSIVFRAGDDPIWNRNETILPMSWRLFSNKIVHPGHDYSLQTIPTLSSAIDFDVRRNQPDFMKMLDKRLAQAMCSPEAMEMYKKAYGYDDYDIEKLDPDVYSDAIMDIINARIQDMEGVKTVEDQEAFEPQHHRVGFDDVTDNVEVKKALAVENERMKEAQRKIFAGGALSRDDLVSLDGHIAGRQYEQDIIDAYLVCRAAFERDRTNFSYRDATLWSATRDESGMMPWYIRKLDETQNLEILNTVKDELTSRVYADNDINEADFDRRGSFEVSDDFYRFLASQSVWTFAGGEFEREMARRFRD